MPHQLPARSPARPASRLTGRDAPKENPKEHPKDSRSDAPRRIQRRIPRSISLSSVRMQYALAGAADADRHGRHRRLLPSANPSPTPTLLTSAHPEECSALIRSALFLAQFLFSFFLSASECPADRQPANCHYLVLFHIAAGSYHGALLPQTISPFDDPALFGRGTLRGLAISVGFLLRPIFSARLSFPKCSRCPFVPAASVESLLLV